MSLNRLPEHLCSEWRVAGARSSADFTASWIAVLAVLALSFTTAHAQSAGDVDGLSPVEISLEANFLKVTDGGASVSRITTRGISVRVGYRPPALPRSLIEVYGMHAPESHDPYNRAPRIQTLGLAGSYLLRSAHARFNPYLTLGGGLYQTQVTATVECRIEEGCLNEGPFFNNATLPSAVAGAGLYATLVPMVSVRADARVYAPFVYTPYGDADQVGDSAGIQPALSIGISVRP